MQLQCSVVGTVFFFLVSMLMTFGFIWQYRMPKLKPVVVLKRPVPVEMCPRFPEPVPLTHPITSLRVALEKMDLLLRSHVSSRLPAVSAVVLLNDSVLWNAHFGKRNTSDPSSPPPDEYTMYRIASVSKVFPTLMMYKLWEDGSLGSLDDPLDKYVPDFSIKNPLGGGSSRGGSRGNSRGNSPSSALTLRRMASQLSGLPRRLRSTNLLWDGDTGEALRLLEDDVLVADPGTRCHYSNVAFSLLGRVLGERVAGQDFESWVSENILQKLNMEDTGFDWRPSSGRPLAVGVYSSGLPAPLYDLGWYRPAGQMYSTTADMAKLTMALLGVPGASLLKRDTLTTMLTPLFRCHTGYFANATGTPWEINRQLGYDVVRKDGDLDGYAATLSLVPRLKLGLVLLMAGVRPMEDPVKQAYSYLIPVIENAFREATRTLRPPPDPLPYLGFFTYRNMTFYEVKADSAGVLVMQQFGPQVNASIPTKYLTIRLDYLEERVFRVVFETPYPCKLKVHSASVSLETQDRQLFNFYAFNKKGLSPGFDSPGLNTYRVLRIAGRPFFTA